MKRLKLLLAIAAYLMAFVWAIATIISPSFGYLGLRITWPSWAGMAWLILLSLLPGFLLPQALEKPSILIIWWLYIAGYIPSILIPALTLSLSFRELAPLQVSLLLCMAALCVIPSLRPLTVGRLTLNPGLFWSGFVLIWLLCLAVVFENGRSSMVLVNLASLFSGGDEYLIRSAYLAQRSPALAYVVGQLGQALDPFLIAFGLVRRNKLCLLAGIIGQVIIFSLTGFKTVLFSSLFLTGVAWLMRRWKRTFGLALTTLMLTSILACAVTDLLTEGVIFSSLLTRRTLAVPGQLTGDYFEYYSRVDHAGIGYHFSHTGPVSSPPSQIGFVYFGDANIDANANLWAEGYADFGIPGIFAFTLLSGFLLWMYDSVASKQDWGLAVLLAAMPAVAFSNTAPTTVLLTHGALAAAVLLYFAPRSLTAKEPQSWRPWQPRVLRDLETV